MSEKIKNNIQYLKGIGEKRAAAFNKSDIYTVEDLLTFYPKGYENWLETVDIENAPADSLCAVRAWVTVKYPPVRTSGGRLITKIKATDGKDDMTVTFFNNPYVSKNINTGEEYIFYGRIINREMTAPKYEKAASGAYIHPVYRQNALLNSKAIAKAVKTALKDYSDCIEETLPAEQIEKYKLMGYKEALNAVHFPASGQDIINARRRLIYEELLILQLGILSSGNKGRDEISVSMKKDYTKEFISTLPYTLTGAQLRAVRECAADMSMKTPMRRLIQGDVGSGKTAVAAALIYSAVKNGFQCALMAPTEVLARQHAQTFGEFFKDTGINTVLLTGSLTAKNKRLIKEDIKSGKAQVIIGTHAVITDDTVFRNLALAVTDEQHRFGVGQRGSLREKGVNPHVLVMSATPIPRTLSLIIYGDLDISVIDEKPKGRKDIETYRVTKSYHQRLYSFIRKQVSAGHQCYIVCPLVEENEDSPADRISAEKYIKELSSTVFSDLNTALLHGKMKQAEKDRVMQDFKEGRTDILICTVVIEVGIDVPNANTIVIENAECFGLSQLHQLRGRVGRGDSRSYCVLVSDARNKEANDRFDILCNTNDGFALAEEDLKMRGPGDFFGSRQSGLPAMKIASLLTDSRILYAAREEAQKIINEDPQLTNVKNASLRKKITHLFTDIS